MIEAELWAFLETVFCLFIRRRALVGPKLGVGIVVPFVKEENVARKIVENSFDIAFAIEEIFSHLFELGRILFRSIIIHARNEFLLFPSAPPRSPFWRPNMRDDVARLQIIRLDQPRVHTRPILVCLDEPISIGLEL